MDSMNYLFVTNFTFKAYTSVANFITEAFSGNHADVYMKSSSSDRI